jgi:hypothetical protein
MRKAKRRSWSLIKARVAYAQMSARQRERVQAELLSLPSIGQSCKSELEHRARYHLPNRNCDYCIAEVIEVVGLRR